MNILYKLFVNHKTHHTCHRCILKVCKIELKDKTSIKYNFKSRLYSVEVK